MLVNTKTIYTGTLYKQKQKKLTASIKKVMDYQKTEKRTL